ncbi:uncharacterized protein FLJ43738 [Brachyistius frenatus]|uniref:uncharacterized protein FLJ43738 n=1 Tax=Brachyistius frenatus TaxID=100188 RepID=UPI0037E73A14
MANRSAMSLCYSQPDRDDGEVTDKRREEVLALEAALLFGEHTLKTKSGSTEDITAEADDRSYNVTWTIYVFIAVPRGKESDAAATAKKRKVNSSNVLLKPHKAQSFFHIEHELLPGDTGTAKMDLVMFGPVAKLYSEDNSKLIKTWHEGDQTWVGWAQKFNIRVDRDVLVGLLSHKIRLQIWNNKNKMARKVWFETQKVLRLPQDQSEDATDMCGGFETLVNQLKSSCEKRSKTNKKQQRDEHVNSSSAVTLKSDMNSTSQLKPTRDAVDLENIKAPGNASVEISPVLLLAGETSLAECFPVDSSGVFEVVCSITLDRPLLSERLKAELNPLVITILSATSMPSSPAPFHVLRERCAPVYCQYKFHNLKVHRTRRHEHGAKIDFDDVNVILTGLMSPKERQEFFSGLPLEIEVHDRDTKLEEAPKTPATSGTGSDEHVQRVGSALLKRETGVADPHGIASLDLSELLLGKTSLKGYLPIRCCPPPQPLERERRAWARRAADAGARGKPTSPGHYYDANSQLKVKVAIACPLNVENDDRDPESRSGPFGRIVYLFACGNSSALTRLRSEIVRINASAFDLGSGSLESVETALSNFKMNFKQDKSGDLDIVTGFHVLDKRTHIFVLEGLKREAVERLREAVPMKLSGSEEQQVIVLYNSKMGFFKRIYGSLDVDLSTIHLCEPLEMIMRNPLIYIRGQIPQPCFQALSRLNQLREEKELHFVAQHDLFPSADMIFSLAKQYGTGAETWTPDAAASVEEDEPAPPARAKRRSVVDSRRPDDVGWRRDSRQTKCFIRENIKKAREESERLRKPEAAVLRIERAAAGPAHNYSVQTFNSNVLAQQRLRGEMAEVPDQRFTYCQQYHSATVAPGPVTSKTESSSNSASTDWVASTGASGVHPRHPDEARVEDLRKPWRENILHDNTMKPPVPRDYLAWDQRSKDFQLFSKAPPFFGTPPALTRQAGVDV